DHDLSYRILSQISLHLRPAASNGCPGGCPPGTPAPAAAATAAPRVEPVPVPGSAPAPVSGPAPASLSEPVPVRQPRLPWTRKLPSCYTPSLRAVYSARIAAPAPGRRCHAVRTLSHRCCVRSPLGGGSRAERRSLQGDCREQT